MGCLGLKHLFISRRESTAAVKQQGVVTVLQALCASEFMGDFPYSPSLTSIKKHAMWLWFPPFCSGSG